MPQKTKKLPKAPSCLHCSEPAKRVTGRVIYPNSPDYHDLIFYSCDPCGAYVGTHKVSTKPLGRPGNEETRNARKHLHKILDPIWKNAWQSPAYGRIDPSDREARLSITRSARSRVYRFLAECMGISREQCHTAMFDIEQCRFAWVICKGISYKIVKDWHDATKDDASLEK